MCRSCFLRQSEGEIFEEEPDFAGDSWTGPLSDWRFQKVPVSISFENGTLQFGPSEIQLVLSPSRMPRPPFASQETQPTKRVPTSMTPGF